jgi:tRNA threonylcarbamoyl adenosine modification protein YeaZ
MVILGLETSGEFASIALVKDGKLLTECRFFAYKKLLEKLLPLIDFILKENNLKISELQGIGITSGPGSFTGIRIGVVTAKTISQCLSIPIVSFSTLQIISLNYYSFENDFIISPVIDGKMQELYTAFFWKNKRIEEDILISVDDFIKRIKKFKKRVVLTGNGLKTYGEIFKKELNEKILLLPENFWYPLASNVAKLSEEKIKKGEFTSYLKINPVYLKSSQPERRYERRKNIS